jgi:polysaccharide deacetylase 2 family uncharacterized protein YibQ
MRVRFIVVIVIFIVLAGGGYYAFHNVKRHHYLHALLERIGVEKYSPQSSSTNSAIEKNIFSLLKTIEIPDSLISLRSHPGDSTIQIRVSVPRGKPIEWIIWRLSSAIEGTNYRVDDCFCIDGDRDCKLRFVSSIADEPPVLLDLFSSSRYFARSARLAILVSEFGFSADQTTVEYLSFSDPLTVSLAPSRKLASWTAEISNEYKKEIVVLLPMEPLKKNDVRSGLKPIMVDYAEAKIRDLIKNAAESAPNFAGFGNLSGARVLADSRVMDIVFSEVKKRHGYFIEDKSTRKSVAALFAKKFSVPITTVDCKVDTSLKSAQIQELLRRSTVEAQKRGLYIISTRATPQFIRALKSELPYLRKNGIKLSYLSELLSAPAENSR